MSNLTLNHSTPATVIRLSGRPLAAARLVWLVVCVATTLAFLVALPYRWDLLAHPSPTNLANLTALGLTPTFFAAYSIFWEIVIAAPYLIVGFIIFWRCGDERIALLTSLVLVVFGVGSGTFTPTIRALLGLNPALDFLQHLFEFIAWFGFALFFYLFPNGRFVPGWTRWVAVALLPMFLLWNFAGDTPLAPLNWPVWLAVPIFCLQWGTWLFSPLYRYRRVSSALERQQIKWVVFAVVVIVVVIGLVSLVGAFVPGFELFSEEQPTPQSFGYMLLAWFSSPVLPLLPIAIAFSIMRYRLWDIDRLISRTLVYGAMTTLVIVTYVAVVGGLGTLFQSNGNFFFSLIAAGLIAVAFQPLRDRLQRAVNRLLYGERDDPYAVLSRLRQRLDLTLAPNAVLPTIVETVSQTLKLPYAAIRLNNQTMAVYGALPLNVQAESFPLAYQGETIGYLEVAPRAPGESFTPHERRLLADMAHQAGVVTHNIRLAADLQRARERLVTAREEERRRLRRDLHDGLGPKLAGQALILEAIRDSLEPDSQNYALADHLIKDSQTIVTEVRELVHGLRPPALDDFGLAGAVRALAAKYESGKLRISVIAPEPMPPLPAAVEVAAYRITQEALTNVVKHAQASSCAVRIVIAKELSLEILDNGRGLLPNRQAGVGLSSMRERAEEIGGLWQVETAENGGTRVLAKLPLTNYL